jgi:uncharacterized protein YbjT (DUF2867 family)
MKRLPLVYLLLLLLAIATPFAASHATDNEAAQARTVLVTGATGTQGGAVARELVSRGYAVYGMTRNPTSDRAKALSNLGVTLVKGDFEDPDSLHAAMKGMYGVFAMTDWSRDDFNQEIEHGRNLVEAAKSAGVSHFVYTSVSEAETNTGIPHFDSKWEVEKIVYDSGLAYSIVRPVEFMDNFRYSRDNLMSGVFNDARAPGSRHQWIAARDIGFFVGEAFDHPDEWRGKAQSIAGDEMTIAELVALLSEVLGVEIKHNQITWDELESRAGEEIAIMYRWFENPGYQADLTALRERYPDLTTMEEYVRSLNWH